MGTEGLERIASLGNDETSPDMLRNTPSNIQRLNDEIEQFEGRRKYLAQTRSPSDGGDVRWYFCKAPLGLNQLAASIPRAEVVGKGEYFRFGMRDSLAIEACFLQREEDLLSYWWKEYAECSVGPKGQSSTEEGLLNAEISELYAVEEERVGVPVKGGLYEVDLRRRQSFPVYWTAGIRRVLRGHWFAQSGGLDWLPLREDVAEQLEFAYQGRVWHRRTFQPSGLFAARVDVQGSTPGLHVLFTGEDHTWEAWLNADASGFSTVMNFGGNGIKLRRGYAASQSPKPTQDELRQQKEEEMDDYCSEVPVRHLVFMVHGIGQRLEKSNLVDDVTTFRHITSDLAEQHLTSHQRRKQRVLFIPCQWRKGLKLSSESAVEKITLDGVRGLRTVLSATVHDVLYYMSPIHCQDIIDSVSNQLNRLYLKFLKRNPGYDGKVSIYGHSLGSVLSFDILCHQEHWSSQPSTGCLHKEQVEESQSYGKQAVDSCSDSGGTTSFIVDQDKINGNLAPLDLKKEHCQEISPTPSVECLETSGFLDSRSLNNEDQGDVSEKRAAEVLEEKNGKEAEILALTQKIDLLNAKVADLESQIKGKDHNGRESSLAIESTQGDAAILSMEQDKSSKNDKAYIKYSKLEFQVDTFYAVGSPLGVFLALRNVRLGIGQGKEYWQEEHIIEEMPACRQMFNIFHPFDPVAYRVEPLVCRDYVTKRPVIIPYHKGGKRLHIGLQEFAEDVAARSEAVMDRLNSMRDKVLTVCQSKNKESLGETAPQPQNEERSYGSLMMELLTGSQEGRMDHVLQDKTFQHAYISVLGSHTNYWRDHDTALFILKHLYRDIPALLDDDSDFVKVHPRSRRRSNSHEKGADRDPLADEKIALISNTL